ncbi:hypothetical protein AGLY_009944 [Aphis glycines]|uniref:SLC26A/SulP transporter domain-containing protein n=1 Tax=Aphis glycines TaxID=307491 RepID=A0A6G0TG20_APHGL|nr:hypothetical protein AGLY_009944 [Aphis glycines]
MLSLSNTFIQILIFSKILHSKNIRFKFKNSKNQMTALLKKKEASMLGETLCILYHQIPTVISFKFNKINFNYCKSYSHFVCNDIDLYPITIFEMLALIHIGSEEVSQRTKFQQIINRTMWLIGTFRNSIVIIVTTFIGFVYVSSSGHDVTSNELPPIPFKVIGKIPAGLPDFDFPKFSITRDNGTTVGFFEMVSDMGSGLWENLLMLRKSYWQLACVISEIRTGSFSRSAVNAGSGVRTPMGGLYSGILVIVALLFCTPYFYYIPKSALAAIIIAAVIFMVEIRVVKPIYRSKKSDLIPGLGTFFACLLLHMEIGILIGVGLNLISILYHAARPKLSIRVNTTRSGINYLMMTPDRCLIFPSVDYVRNIIIKHSLKQNLPVVIDCSHIYGADFTAAKVIELLTIDFSRRGQLLFFYNLKPSLVNVFEGVRPKDFNIRLFYEIIKIKYKILNIILICFNKKSRSNGYRSAIFWVVKFECNDKYHSIRKTILNEDNFSPLIIVNQTYGKSCIKFSTLSYLYKNLLERKLNVELLTLNMNTKNYDFSTTKLLANFRNFQRFQQLIRKLVLNFQVFLATKFFFIDTSKPNSQKNRKFQLAINSSRKVKISYRNSFLSNNHIKKTILSKTDYATTGNFLLFTFIINQGYFENYL